MTLTEVYQKYQPTVGIECHVQLKTKTKLFSGADNDARDRDPNTTISPLCFGFPGVLPVLNAEALTLAVRAGLAMNSEIPRLSRFERKHYFYPDLPLGYQITQLAEPVIMGGKLNVPQLDGSSKVVRIHHAHLEADAGKLTHPIGGAQSFVDLNRAGTPLIEIVSEPDMNSPAEARAYAQELYLLMKYADVTHGDLYQGNMRFDVNISLAPHGSDKLGNRAEIKNLNSFRSVEKAAEFECLRQAELLETGESIVQETRGWNEDKQKTFSQRSKEDAHDYRYFPDADIPPVIIESAEVETVRQAMPVLPPAYRVALGDIGIDTRTVEDVLSVPGNAKTVYDVLEKAGGNHARRIAFWLLWKTGEVVEAKGIHPAPVGELIGTERLIKLSHMVEENKLSSTAAKDVLFDMIADRRDPEVMAKDMNLLQESDESELEAIVETVLADAASAKAVEDIKAGNDKAIGFIVGQAMKHSQGKANPAVIQKIVRERLGL